MSETDELVDVLVQHQRQRGGCLCGWNRLGYSHPEHVAAKIRETVDVAVREGKPDVTRMLSPEVIEEAEEK